MFSDHLQKNEHSGRRLLLMIAAALVIACQLVAMALLADGQVQKAALRDAELSSRRTALAQCFESVARMNRDTCLVQARNDKRMDADSSPASLPAVPSGLTVVSFSSNAPVR